MDFYKKSKTYRNDFIEKLLDYYEDLNANLRYGGLTPVQKLFAGFLNEALDKLPDYVGTVFRGAALNNIQIEKYKQAFEKQEAIVEKSFLSSSKESYIAEQFNKGKVIFIIDSKQGKSVEMFSHYGIRSSINEAEVLFKTESSFIVTNIEYQGSKNLIYLNEINMEQYKSMLQNQSRFEELEMNYISESLLSSFMLEGKDLNDKYLDKKELEIKYNLLLAVLDAVTKKLYSRDDWSKEEKLIYMKAIYKLSTQKGLFQILLADDPEQYMRDLQATSERFAKKMQSSVK